MNDNKGFTKNLNYLGDSRLNFEPINIQKAFVFSEENHKLVKVNLPYLSDIFKKSYEEEDFRGNKSIYQRFFKFEFVKKLEYFYNQACNDKIKDEILQLIEYIWLYKSKIKIITMKGENAGFTYKEIALAYTWLYNNNLKFHDFINSNYKSVTEISGAISLIVPGKSADKIAQSINQQVSSQEQVNSKEKKNYDKNNASEDEETERNLDIELLLLKLMN